MAAPISKRRKTSDAGLKEDHSSGLQKPKFSITTKAKAELVSIPKPARQENTDAKIPTRILKKSNRGELKKTQTKTPRERGNEGNGSSETSDNESQDEENDEYNIDNISSADENTDDASSGEGEEEEEEDEDSDEDAINQMLEEAHPTKKRKRTDPELFSQSMSKILSSHLTTTLRKDPILVRSTHREQHIDSTKLEAKAKRLLAQERKKDMDMGRIRDVIPKDDVDGEEVKKVLEREKALRKVAQRGVVKLFNAVRAAQVKGEESAKEQKNKGVVGIDTRESKVTEMSKQGFLDMIQAGGQSNR